MSRENERQRRHFTADEKASILLGTVRGGSAAAIIGTATTQAHVSWHQAFIHGQ